MPHDEGPAQANRDGEREQTTWVEVDLDALAANLRLVRALVGSRPKIQLVVKADAYGHGATAVARVAQEEGCHSLGVATLDEGIELRRDRVHLPILVLSPGLAFEADRLVAHDLTPTLGDLDVAQAVGARARAAGRDLGYHVEIDTGMGRSGVAPADALEFLRALRGIAGLRLEGLFTHFPRGDARAGAPLVARQLRDLAGVAADCRSAGIEPGLLHAANSAGIVHHPASHLDLVRPGILAYGVVTSDFETAPAGLRPVMRFATRLVHVRTMPAGHAISYGGDFTTPEAMRVGTAAVGYGHGYPWSLSGKGSALLHGRRVPILGRVTMDTTVFDLRAVPGAALGDEMTLFGGDRYDDAAGGEGSGRGLAVGELARTAGTISYELLIGIGRRVPRVYLRGGRHVGERTLLGSTMETP